MSFSCGIGQRNAYRQDPAADRWRHEDPGIAPIDNRVSLPYPTAETHHNIGEKFDALFSRLTTRFDDVQFYGSHRVVDFVAWARAVNGKPLRMFAYAGGGDGVLANVGEQTPEEAKLRFADLTGLSLTDALDEMSRIADEQRAEQDALVASGLSRREAIARVRQNGPKSYPNETDVLELAGLWGIDPMELSEQDHPLSGRCRRARQVVFVHACCCLSRPRAIGSLLVISYVRLQLRDPVFGGTKFLRELLSKFEGVMTVRLGDTRCLVQQAQDAAAGTIQFIALVRRRAFCGWGKLDHRL